MSKPPTSWSRTYRLSFRECDVILNAVPIDEQPEHIGVLHLPAPVGPLEPFLLSEGI